MSGKCPAVTFGAVVLILFVLTGCQEEEKKQGAVGVAEQYIDGTKRFAGAYQRQVGFSRVATSDMGEPDVQVEVRASIDGFEPKELTFKKDQIVELVLVGVDDGQLPALTACKMFSGHGFHVYGYDIWVNGLRAGSEVKIKFKAVEAGKFPFECPVFCGVNHYKMIGMMTVE
ncbi:MAG: cupredoxin domain-containing protein [Planctomycetota bacterium]|jgi:hypothetical protein|nr:cupredoxin domain-containing protein [Planctomycetota bacterium]